MYITLAEFASDVPALLGFENKEELAGIVAQILDKASRSFDSETFVPEGYYGWKPTDEFEVKTFRTNGTKFLHTYHFTEIEHLLYGTDIISPERYRLGQNNQFLLLGYGSWYPYGANFSVSAKWGWLSIPEDVKNAISAKARIRMSSTPLSRLGIDTALGEDTIGDLQKEWDNIVQRYRHLNQFAA